MKTLQSCTKIIVFWDNTNMITTFLQIAMIFDTSRGRHLDLHVKPKNEAVVFFRSGAKITQLKAEACSKIQYYKRKYDIIHVYFLVGIPDITIKVSRGAYEETILTKSQEKFTTDLNDKILELTSAVKDKGCRVCVCTIAPLDIEKWNRHRLTIRKTTHLEHQAQYKEWQKTIERAIIQIDKFIIEINIANHMITPFVGDTAMTKKGSRVKKHYEKFPDGLHPGDELIKIWGEQIATRIDANFSISGGAAAAVPTPSQKDDKKDTPDGDHSPTRSPKRNWKTYWERTPARHTYLYNIY